MSNLQKLLSVPVPETLALRPKDARGFPIPFVSAEVNGKHDFRVIDHEKWKFVVARKVCQMCGQPIVGDIWFIGGPSCMVNHFFFDPGMHEDCARYALQVCPYLALPKFAYAKWIEPGEGIELRATESVSMDRPERFGLLSAAGHQAVLLGRDLLVQAVVVKSIEWFKEGEPCDPPEVLPAPLRFEDNS